MEQEACAGKRFDTQTWTIRTIKKIVTILFIGIAIKYVFLDSTFVKNDQMSPVIMQGDNILVFRVLSLPIIKKLFHTALNTPVIFKIPDGKGKRNCLRVTGYSGDVVKIDSAQFYINDKVYRSLFQLSQSAELLPENYSPRDYFAPYKIPSPGDTLNLDTLSTRDFFFTLSIIRQESKSNLVSFTTELLLDDSIANDYIINGFTLYSGTIKEIPDQLRNDWFFWIQLKQYLENVIQKRIKFKFTLTKNGSKIRKYITNKPYVFLLADNWVTGFDSRYLGPIAESLIIGRPFMVWWSKGETGGLKSIRISRIGRLII